MGRMYNIMQSNATNIGKALAHAALEIAGAANGAGNRARTFLTKKEKANCPRKQRKQKSWLEN